MNSLSIQTQSSPVLGNQTWGKSRSQPNRQQSLSGISITAIGASPYIVGGHLVDISDWMVAFVPRLSNWDSRHQLLLGLGLAIMISGVLGSSASTFKRHVVAVVFGLCVLWNFIYMHSYYLDSLKQDQVISSFRGLDDLERSRIIMINDTTGRFNARGTTYCTYKWNGMLAKALGDDSRSAISGASYVHCNDSLIPDTLLTVTARSGRLTATMTRDLGIEITLEEIHPYN